MRATACLLVITIGALSGSATAAQPRVGETIADSSPAWPERASPPAGAPNVVMIVVDDLGFAQLGSYGSVIRTPNIDRLAAAGLRYTKPIDTAPNDAVPVLVFRPTAPVYRQMGIDRRDTHYNGQWWHTHRDEQPTHWMPLPEPPK